jgi:ATP-dependent DNA ligase
MIATTAHVIPIHEDVWAYEPKFDGFRCIAYSAGGRVSLLSRQGKSLTRCFPEIVAAVSQLRRDVVLDGELVLWRNGRLDFTALQRRLTATPAGLRSPAAYVVFDILASKSNDLRGRPYRKRRRKLEKLLERRLPDGLVLVPMATDATVAHAWLRNHSPAGIEGVVAKQVKQTYRSGRSGWQKIRCRNTAEAVVGGVIGSVAAPEALVLGLTDQQGRLRVAGRTTRLPPHVRPEIGRQLTAAPRAHPWPATIPSSRFGQLPGERVEYTQVEPSLVVEVDVDAAFEQERWRHPPRFVRTRPDMDLAQLPSIQG